MSRYIGARADEVFVGNVRTRDGIPEYLSGLLTVRMGDQALDIEGKKIDPAYMLPMFVGRGEAAEYDRIMMRRTFPMMFR